MNLPIKVDLTGKVAAITGGAGVLCSHFAQTLAASGAAVAVIDINEKAAAEVVKSICDAGGRAVAAAANCLDRQSLAAAYEKIKKELGTVDILINGAGGNNPKGTTDNEQMLPADLENTGLKTFFDLDPDGIRFVFDLNMLAAFLTSQVFARDMVGKGGTIINISSMNAFRPLTKIPAYSAAKAAVSNLTQWMAVHFAPSGIRVNAMAPGFFVTKQNRSLLFDENGEPTARSAKIIAHTPQAKFGAPEDLDGTLLWLASEEASGFVTGIIVPVDGGFSAYSGV